MFSRGHYNKHVKEFNIDFESFVVSVSAFLYFLVSSSYFCKQKYEWSFVWLCYSLANIALILAANKK